MRDPGNEVALNGLPFFFLLRDNEVYQYFKSAHASIKIGKLILAVCAVKNGPFFDQSQLSSN